MLCKLLWRHDTLCRYPGSFLARGNDIAWWRNNVFNHVQSLHIGHRGWSQRNWVFLTFSPLPTTTQFHLLNQCFLLCFCVSVHVFHLLDSRWFWDAYHPSVSPVCFPYCYFQSLTVDLLPFAALKWECHPYPVSISLKERSSWSGQSWAIVLCAEFGCLREGSPRVC